MLARQWQTGEFMGEDAGSPIEVLLDYSTQSIRRIKLGDADSVEAPTATPLETCVEQERVPLDYRERVRIGQEFERRLRTRLEGAGRLGELEGLLDTLRAPAALGFPKSLSQHHELDRATWKFTRLMRGRVVDGETLLDGPLEVPGVGSPQDDDLEAVRQEVVDWYGRVCARPTRRQPSAWQPGTLDSHFELNTYPEEGSEGAVPENEQETQLVAPEYRNGTVDWYTFSAGAEGARSWEATAQAADPVVTTPTRIAVSGASPRWWAFEDAQTDFGDIDVAKPDLSKLLLMEFALIYGDDWFSVPAPVRLGSLVRIDRLGIRNVFDEFTPVEPARTATNRPARNFDLFSISPADDPTAPGIAVPGSPDRPLLFVPPVAGFRQESEPLEEVQFLRDEGANMVWGVEQTVQNGIGCPVHGFDAQRERLERAREVEQAILEALIEDVQRQLEDTSLSHPESDPLRQQARLAQARLEELSPDARPTPSQNDVPRYRLMTSVPENWIPFIPVQRHEPSLAPTVNRSGVFDLRRAKMLRTTEHPKLDGGLLTQEILETAATRLGLPDDAFEWMSGGPTEDHVPSASHLLALGEDSPLLWLREEVVQRSGLQIQLTKQRTRWIDGTTHVWVGRKIMAGRGEGASGLIFDVVAGHR